MGKVIQFSVSRFELRKPNHSQDTPLDTTEYALQAAQGLFPVKLCGADYGALGVLDKTGKRISLASFRSAEGVKPKRVLKIVEEHGGARHNGLRVFVAGNDASIGTPLCVS